VKVVIDTNVLVSGLLNPFGSSGEIVRMIASGQLILCYDARIISEYSEVLNRRKFDFDKMSVEILLSFIKETGIPSSPTPIKKLLPDEDDVPFLEVALAEDVEFLVTGNISHFPEKYCKKIKVVSPKKFIEMYRKDLL